MSPRTIGQVSAIATLQPHQAASNATSALAFSIAKHSGVWQGWVVKIIWEPTNPLDSHEVYVDACRLCGMPLPCQCAAKLADAIGPISTRADRIRIIQQWIDSHTNLSLP